VQAPEWKAGVKGKTTLMSKFEQEFALRVSDAVSTISPTSPAENPPIFREDSHSIEADPSNGWLLAYGNDERIDSTSIDHSFGDVAPSRGIRESADESRGSSAQGDSLGSLQPRDWRVNPKTLRRRDRAVGRRVIDKKKGEPLSTLLDEATDAITPQMCGILEALYQDVTREVWRKPVEEQEQLEWLVQEYGSFLLAPILFRTLMRRCCWLCSVVENFVQARAGSGGVDSSVAALLLQRQVIPLNFLLQIFLKTLLSF
jgi:hypothetical protein